jgi:hypothetical protein
VIVESNLFVDAIQKRSALRRPILLPEMKETSNALSLISL